MTHAIISLWWLWLILSIWLPWMLIIAVPTTILMLLSLFDTSELTLEGLRGKPVKPRLKKVLRALFRL